MSEEKRKRGRPRIYQDDAEKHRVFRQKRKDKILKLEAKLAELEKESKTEVPTKTVYPWFDWTMADLAKLSVKDLQDFRKELRKATNVSIYSPIKVIIDDLADKSNSSKKPPSESKKTLSQAIVESSRRFDEDLVNSTIAYLIELELSTRQIDGDYNYEIDLAVQRISELEKEIEDKKKVKKSAE